MKSRFCTVILVFCVSVLSIASDTFAQAIPVLTDPIKVRELELMSNQVDMTMSQQEAVIDVYDRYLEDFARVRSGEIKTFEDSIAEAAETFGFMQFQIPERELVEGLIRQAQRAIRAIHRADSLFFDEVSGMLTEKQRSKLKHIRIARELEAYELFIVEMLGGINKGGRAQLRNLYANLDTELNVEIEEVLDTYDQRYLKEVKEGFDAVIETVRIALDQIDELNVRGMDQQALMMRFMADPEAIEDLKKRGEILLKPLVDQAYELSQLNWKTWSKLDSLLDEDNARRLQQWYFGKSFRDAVRGGTKVDGYLKAAIGLNTISEGQRIDLKELQNSFNTKWPSLTGKYAEVLEQSRQVLTVAIMSGDVPSGFEERLDTLETERQEYIDKTTSRIESILGKEFVAQLSGKATSESKNKFIGDNDEALVFSSKTGEALSEAEIKELKQMSEAEIKELKQSGTGDVSFGKTDGKQAREYQTVESKDSKTLWDDTPKLAGGATIPQPIAPSFPVRAAKILDLGRSEDVIIDAVYNEYREKYDEVYQNVAIDSDAIVNDDSLQNAARTRKIRDISKSSADVVAALDTTLFDDLATVHSIQRDDINLTMLEDHRNRQRMATPDDPFGWGGGEGETIDLVGLYVMSKESDVLTEGISSKSKTVILNAMQGYHQRVAGVHQQYVDASYNLAHTQDAMNLMWNTDATTSASPSGEMAEMMQARLMKAFTAVRDTKRLLMLENQTVMDTLLKQVPESDFWKVRIEFVTKAYPDVFTKNSDITPMLTAASAIQSLNQSQKSKIESLESSYRYDYWNLCEAIIENHQSNASAQGGEGYMNKEDIHRALSLETLRFKRRELNDRIQMRLRMVLNENQIKDVPGLRPSVSNVKDRRWQ